MKLLKEKSEPSVSWPYLDRLNMHSQQSWAIVLPNSIGSSLFSWSSLFQRQVQNNFLSFPFLSALFARAKHWVHLKPWHQILPVEEITFLFLWVSLNLRCHKTASRTCFESVFPPPSAFSENYLQHLLGKQNHDILHFYLIATTNTHMKRLGSWIYSYRVMEIIIILYITTWWDWIVWWSNIL